MNAMFGRLCMLAGLLILPVGLSIGLFRDDLQLEVRLLFVGGGLFLAGWLLARRR